jgi:hypothetical protein
MTADSKPSDHQKNVVYVKKDKQFCGTNFTERRVVEAWLIQAFGTPWLNSLCEQCVNDDEHDPKGIFIDCCTLKGFAEGACGNCKRGDRGKQCEKSSTAQKDIDRQTAGFQARIRGRIERRTRAGRRELRSSNKEDIGEGVDVEDRYSVRGCGANGAG